MASFARPSLLRQTLVTTRSPLLRQNVGVSQAVAFHASARKQILPPLPRKLSIYLVVDGRFEHLLALVAIYSMANLLFVCRVDPGNQYVLNTRPSTIPELQIRSAVAFAMLPNKERALRGNAGCLMVILHTYRRNSERPY